MHVYHEFVVVCIVKHEQQCQWQHLYAGTMYMGKSDVTLNCTGELYTIPTVLRHEVYTHYVHSEKAKRNMSEVKHKTKVNLTKLVSIAASIAIVVITEVQYAASFNTDQYTHRQTALLHQTLERATVR